jgi:uncharacterized protein involved in exopolysaccharide biosynthesis
MQQNVPDTIGRMSGQPGLADDIRALLTAFSSRWRLILVIMVAFLAIGVGYIWLSAPAYTSSVEIFTDPRERNLIDLGVTPTGLGSSSQGADVTLVESQIAIVGSRWVLTRLIEREGLEQDPEFNSEPSGLGATLRGLAKRVIYGPNADALARATPFDRTLARLQRAVVVKREGQTYVLSISVTTRSPVRSAQLANALASIYLSEGQSAADSRAQESARSLEARLDELRRTSEASQKAVESYRTANGLVGTQGALIDERQLTDLSAQVVAASVASETARARLDTLRRGGAAAATSDVATQLRLQLDQARALESAVAGTYGTRHPRLVNVRDNVVALQRAFDAEIARVVERAATDYRNAQQTEASLKTMLTQATERLSRSNTASVKLRELEQVAAQNRSLYDAFATRAKQAREQVALPTTTARIISAAEPASAPSEPRLVVVFAASLFLGAVTGLGVAWSLWLFSGPPRRHRNRPPAPGPTDRAAAGGPAADLSRTDRVPSDRASSDGSQSAGQSEGGPPGRPVADAVPVAAS